MKVKIKDLKPNPYRDVENYPIDKTKVENLISSIEQTGFWDNILARQVNGSVQIAYGHHRLEALKKVFNPTDEVDIPVKDLDDVTMLRIMANENMEQWGSNNAVIIETIKAVRNFLDAELAKYETWELFNESIKQLFESEAQYRNTKSKGVGQTTIKKFMGDHWPQWKIQEALAIIKDDEIDDEAAKIFNNQTDARFFKDAVKKLNKERDKPLDNFEQKDLAEKIKTRLDDKKESKTKIGPAGKGPAINTMARQELDGTDEFDAILKDLEVDLKRIETETKQLKNFIISMNGRLHELGVEKFQSIKVVFTMQEISELYIALKTLMEYFGFNNNQKIES